MDLYANTILASLFVGLVGMACFTYGRRQGRVPPMVAGAVLIVYPYFVPNLAVMAVVAIAVLASLWGALRLGW
jgi:hypothetical protein